MYSNNHIWDQEKNVYLISNLSLTQRALNPNYPVAHDFYSILKTVKSIRVWVEFSGKVVIEPENTEWSFKNILKLQICTQD